MGSFVGQRRCYSLGREAQGKEGLHDTCGPSLKPRDCPHTKCLCAPFCVCACTQSISQGALVEQQQARLSDLEGSVRQWESRCADLRDLVSGHEARCKEAAAEVLKGNDVIDKLQVGVVSVPCARCRAVQ